METMYDRIAEIRERSTLYNIFTARDLYHFINGYDLAIGVNKIDDPTVSHFGGFAEWLREKEPGLSKFDWLKII